MKQSKPPTKTQSWCIPGRKCWVETALPEIFLPATIKSLDENTKKIEVAFLSPPDASVPRVFDQSLIYEFNEQGKPGEDFEDMVSMDCLNEPELLNNLKARYLRNEIFTYIGPTLLILNPYKSLGPIFSESQLSVYQKQTKSELFNLKETPPHVFAISAKAYYQLFQHKRNQAIVISGESGAGKTENTKYAMKFLTSLSGPNKPEEAKTQDFEESPIEERILSCNPLLESFGNAKTVRNDNSSRFGKYVRILVDLKTRKIQGAAISNYLLEKSRVTLQAPGERNYHIFYQLFHCEDKQLLSDLRLIGKTLDSFEYLRQTVGVTATSVNDQEFYQEVWQSFEKMRFTSNEKTAIYRMLAGILYLGNLRFDPKTLTDKNPCKILDRQVLADACAVLGFQEPELEKALVYKTREIGKQLIESPISLEECGFLRDSLSKGLYERLFSWLVRRLNLAILPKDDFSKTRSVRKSIKDVRRSVILKEVNIRVSVGLLDIFGFENFQVNSFEQLCINFTNEKLQQLYIAYVFKSEEAEFIEQGLKDQLYRLSYEDNQPIIDLIDKYPMGIFDLLDESCSLGSGTDDALLQKLAKTYKDNPKFSLKKLSREVFVLTHTAKAVEYTIAGFRNKNKDFLPKELEGVIMRSCFQEIAGIYENKEEVSESGAKKKAEKTLAGKFRGQMKDLMTELMSCDVNFIRCLKPNELKKPDFFLSSFVLSQIKYLGVLESIRIRKEGFPYRKDYANFCESYLDLVKRKREMKAETDARECAGEMLDEIIENGRSNALFGKSKIYLKQDIANELDRRLLLLYKEKRKVALKLIAQFKRFKDRRMLLEKLALLHCSVAGFYKIQAFFRRKQQRRRFLMKKQAISRLNKYFRRRNMRAFLLRWLEKLILFRKWTKKKQSAVKIFGFFKRVLKGFFFRKWGQKARLISEFLLQEQMRKEKELQLAQEKLRREKEESERLAMEKEKETQRKEAEKALKKAALAKSPTKKLPSGDSEAVMQESPLKMQLSFEKLSEKVININEPPKPLLEKPASIEKPNKFENSIPIQKTSSTGSQSLESLEKPLKIDNPPSKPNIDDPPEETKAVYPPDRPKIIEVLTKSWGIINLSRLKPLPPDLFLQIKSGLQPPQASKSFDAVPKPLPNSLQPISQDSTLDLASLDRKLVHSLTQYTFWQFAEPLVSHQRYWGKTVSVASVLSFAKSSVNIPLLPHSDKKDKDASNRVFSIIKKLLKSKEQESELLFSMKIVMEGFNGSTGLRDEIYMQILKQMTNNPDKFLRLKMYRLLGVIGSTFPVSLRTYCVILSFLLEVCQGTTKLELESELVSHARFCFNRITKSFENGGKNVPPLEYELKAIWLMKTIPIKVCFLNNKFLSLYVESWTTVGMTLDLIEKTLEFKDIRQYLGLAIREHTGEDLFLSEETILIEELSRLEMRRMKDTSKEYRLIAKLQLFYPNMNSNPECLDILNFTYFQMFDEFLKGGFQGMQIEDIVHLSSVSLYIEKGGSSYEKIFNIESAGDNMEIVINIEKYTPKGCITRDVTKQYLLVKVLNRYLNNKENKSLDACKLDFCNYLKRFDEYMSTQFKARYIRVSVSKTGVTESSVQEVSVFFKPFLIIMISKGNKNKSVVFHYKEIDRFGTLQNPKGVFAFTTVDLQIHLLESPKMREMEVMMKGYLRLLGNNEK